MVAIEQKTFQLFPKHAGLHGLNKTLRVKIVIRHLERRP